MVLQEWVLFQEKWKGLYKIFESESGKSRLSNEVPAFQKIDKEFLEFMSKASKKTSVLDIFSSPRLGSKFHRLNSEATQLLKTLSPFLQTLKEEATRLRFLSDMEFLQIFGEVVFSISADIVFKIDDSKVEEE